MTRILGQLLAVVSIVFAPFLSSRAEIEQTVGTIVELAAELDSQGIRLCIVRMPVRPEMYRTEKDHYDKPLEERHATTISGDLAEKRLKEAGVQVINLYPDIREQSLLSDIFLKDRFHFTESAEHRIAAILSTKLKNAGIMMLPDRALNAVFMGECFADSFAGQIIDSDPADSIKVLNKNGGGYLVHNYLFVFPNEYLKDTDVVVWIFTDRHFLETRFASLVPDPVVPVDVEPRVVVAKLKEATAFEASDATVLDYPDALRSSVFEVEETGERFIGIDQIFKNRQITLGRKIRVGHEVRLKLVPWDLWIRNHPQVVKIFMVDDVEDFTLPRYWIEDWVIEQ